MSVTGRCRFVVGTLDGKRVSYIVDDPAPPSASRNTSRPSTTGNIDGETYSRGLRPSLSASSVQQDDNDTKINGSVVLNNQQLDDLMDILHQVGEQQQNRQAWSGDEASLNEQYVKECQSAVHEEPTRDYDHESRDSGYFGTGVMKPSLLEVKKQQWAREKAEMQGLLSPWGAGDSEVGTSSYQAAYSQKQENYSGKSSAIPTISYHEHKQNFDSNYPSDISFNHTPDSRMSRSPANHEGRQTKMNGSGDEGRMKWGDRGVTVGHLWEPSSSPSRLPEPKSSSPAWLEKTLGSGGEAEDQNVIYGRKVHIEPAELEEREKRRKKALENQQAIRQQLEERERLRREERERKILEEKLEEERIRKESEVIEERYKKERQREKKNAEEEDEEFIRNQQAGRRGNKQRSGWSNKDLSPRTRNRQRRETESQSQQQRKNDKCTSHEPEILTLNHPPDDGKKFSMHEDYKRLHEDYSSRQMELPAGGDNEMILLGNEVAVLLAPELERRILMSRSGRDVAVQTDLSIFTRRQKSMQQPQPLMAHTKPIWGANRTNKKYMKQSDKDMYRQRGSSLNSRSNKVTTDSCTDDSDKYPRSSSSPQLDRRKRAQSLGKTNNNIRRSSQEDISKFGSRNTRRDTQNEKMLNVQVPISWSVDVRDNQQLERASPNRMSNSPPVPALQMNKKHNMMEVERRISPSPTPNQNFACPPSPPVPAVLRQLQEQTLPPLVYTGNEVKVLKSAPPVLKSFPLQSTDDEKIALPEIKQHLMNLPSESSDLLSQLSTIRKTLQSKHNEWQAVADEA
ncbi:Hypothetical predicted protein [Cloeon dipterum]|uniref:CCDC66 domain-containing protein n=1 Tax=Cloeon dipterum TaxID=197152 RepID=A0A8S1C7Y9_9INSE|nr:Hypothetical predicted protein [Cloeon dipterum]